MSDIKPIRIANSTSKVNDSLPSSSGEGSVSSDSRLETLRTQANNELVRAISMPTKPEGDFVNLEDRLLIRGLMKINPQLFEHLTDFQDLLLIQAGINSAVPVANTLSPNKDIANSLRGIQSKNTFPIMGPFPEKIHDLIRGLNKSEAILKEVMDNALQEVQNPVLKAILEMYDREIDSVLSHRSYPKSLEAITHNQLGIKQEISWGTFQNALGDLASQNLEIKRSFDINQSLNLDPILLRLLIDKGSQFVAKDGLKQELGVSTQDNFLELNFKNKITLNDSIEPKSRLSQVLDKVNFLKSKVMSRELPLDNDFLKSFNELLKLNGGELKLYETTDNSKKDNQGQAFTQLNLSVKYPLS